MNTVRQTRHHHPVRVSTGLLAGALVQTACGNTPPPRPYACGEGAPSAPTIEAPAEPIVTPLELEAAPIESTRPIAVIEIEDTAPQRRPRSQLAAPAAEPPEPVDAVEPEPEPEADRVTGASTTAVEVDVEKAIEAPPPIRADAVSRSYVDEAVRTSGWGY